MSLSLIHLDRMWKEVALKCDFIGIGVQKSATTWVYRVLEDHPNVQVSFPKELDFFSRTQNFDRGFLGITIILIQKGHLKSAYLAKYHHLILTAKTL